MTTKALPKVGETITKRKLTSLYGGYALSVLSAHLTDLDTPRGKISKYKVIKNLPDAAEFDQMKKARYTSSVEDLVGEAFSEFTELGDELRSWYDNMPESFQNADKGSSIDEAASALEEISEPTVPDKLKEIGIYYLPLRDSSRSARRDDAVGKLNAVKEELEKQFPDDTDADELISELGDAIDTAEGVEFPGMY